MKVTVLVLLGAALSVVNAPCQVYQDYSNTRVTNSTGGPMCLLKIGSVADLCITGKEAVFDSKQNVSKGSGYIQARAGQYFSVVVTVAPSDAHKDDLNFTQIQLGLSRMEWNDDAKVTVVDGLNPIIKTLFGEELKATSTGKLLAKDGVIEINLEGGHKLALPLNPSCYANVKNADFLLTKKEKEKEDKK